MDVITFESHAFQEIMKKLEEIKLGLSKPEKKHPLKDKWLDLQEVCILLKISKRTMQYYRTNGMIAYSQVGTKFYYKVVDIEEHLAKHYVKAFGKKIL